MSAIHPKTTLRHKAHALPTQARIAIDTARSVIEIAASEQLLNESQRLLEDLRDSAGLRMISKRGHPPAGWTSYQHPTTVETPQCPLIQSSMWCRVWTATPGPRNCGGSPTPHPDKLGAAIPQ
jgi:hypothetical protein